MFITAIRFIHIIFLVLNYGFKKGYLKMILANLLDNIVIQGNVTIITFDEETESMIVLWETEDFEYDSFNIPYGIATAEVIYMYSKNKPIDEYGELVIEVRFTEE